MQIRWRKQEIVFFTVIALLFTIRLLLTGVEATPIAGTFSHGAMERMVTQEMAPHLSIYLCFLLINAVLIPWKEGRAGLRYWIIAGLLLSWLLIGFAIQFAYVHFIARPGVDIRDLDLGDKAHRIGFSRAGVMVIAYSLILLLRREVNRWILKDPSAQRYRSLVINQLTLVMFVLLGCILFAWIFHFPVSENILVFAGLLIIPSVLLIYYDACLLFPAETARGSSTWRIIARLLLVAVLLAFISMIIGSLLLNRISMETFLLCALVYSLIATPIAWRVWLIMKNQQDSLLNLQKDLGKTSADLQFLRSQVNPHFLFNALNTIYGIAIQERSPRAAEASQRLGDMMRFMLQENLLDRIPLARELEYLDNYITLQRLRIAESETVTIETRLDPPGDDGMIAPMLLIPFVENAFKHGVSFQRPAWIRLRVLLKDGWLQADFSNSVQVRNAADTERLNTGVGLQNVRDRLLLQYPNRHELVIRQNELEYAVHLRIQLHQASTL